MSSAINMEKLADAQRVAEKLARLPEKARVYIAGYVEGISDMSSEQRRAAAAQDSA